MVVCLRRFYPDGGNWDYSVPSDTWWLTACILVLAYIMYFAGLIYFLECDYVVFEVCKPHQLPTKPLYAFFLKFGIKMALFSIK